MPLISWVAKAVNCNTSPTDSSRSKWDRGQHGENHGKQHYQHQCIHHHERRESRRSDPLQIL
ncbi:hypothetical protein DPMN_041583 [Dreissena polymorpha]|uniref:Uncharacterized protein n=1 Tax=Dreissena polymorpha TaxID=45954 RepID=A0A9D4CX34_DREPO|nr:hypothetical protein DPMN_041583 [Dreissena polymorpha]